MVQRYVWVLTVLTVWVLTILHYIRTSPHPPNPTPYRPTPSPPLPPTLQSPTQTFDKNPLVRASAGLVETKLLSMKVDDTQEKMQELAEKTGQPALERASQNMKLVRNSVAAAKRSFSLKGVPEDDVEAGVMDIKETMDKIQEVCCAYPLRICIPYVYMYTLCVYMYTHEGMWVWGDVGVSGWVEGGMWVWSMGTWEHGYMLLLYAVQCVHAIPPHMFPHTPPPHFPPHT